MTTRPVVEALQPKYTGKIDFLVYADCNASEEVGRFAGEHGVTAVPTMVLVDAGGKEVSRRVGGASEGELAEWLDSSF